MRLHFRHLSVIGSTLLMLLMLTAGTAGASSGPHSHINWATLRAAPRHSTPVHLSVTPLDLSTSGTHYLYVDDGTFTDSIDVYKTGKTLTHVGNYLTGGPAGSAYYGASNIAVTNGCLVYGAGNNFVDGFPINADGSLGAMSSHLKVDGPPSDIHINGTTAYVNIPGIEFAPFSIGSGCVLSAEQIIPTSPQMYISFAIVGKDLVTTDLNTDNIDAYALGTDGSITFLKSTLSPLLKADAVAVQKTNSGYNVYTGQATKMAPQAQGGTFVTSTGALTFLKGSPAFDPNGLNGASVTFDNTNSILIQGEQYTDTLANYTVKKGTLAFLSETHLAVSGEQPSTFAQLGSGVFVEMVLNGDVEHCNLSATGATNCRTVATLTNTFGYQAGIAVL